ncbi:MAG: zinc-binding dehydrogenase [Chloroflexota bacterium]|nr:MAG: zinc-binding dehydrogenase [Chloroflexota bacterium]
MNETVRAPVLVTPGKIEIQSFPMPEPEPGAVLIRREMCGICGTDKHSFSGYAVQYSGTDHERSLPFPIIPGHEIVGVIAAIGPSHENLLDFSGLPLQAGDRVILGANLSCGQCYYCRHGFDYFFCANMEDYGNSLSAANSPHLFGGFADFVYALPGSYLFKVPKDLPVEIAVLTEVMSVTIGLDKAKQFSAVNNEGFRFGDTVVVQGVGPLGLCHVIKARMLGAGNIIVTDRSSLRLELALEMGADMALNVGHTSPKERIEAVREMTAGRGADIVVECAGVPEVIPEGLEILRPGGFYIESGNFSDMGDVSIKPHLLCAKNLRIIGIGGEAITAYHPSMEALLRYRQHYPLHKIVTHRYPVEEAEAAMRCSMTDDSMKVVIASSEYL